jgi:ureidoglycolate lyase
VPVAKPGDDLRAEDVIALWSDGSFGIHIHPGIWHEGVFPVATTGRFFDKQGRWHARVSCDLAGELGVLLNVPLPTGPLPPS